MPRRALLTAICLAATVIGPAADESRAVRAAEGTAAPSDVLSPAQRRMVDRAVDRALAMIAANQRSDGSFPTPVRAQPGVTALCVQAFLTRGHLPGAGPYGEKLNSAVGYILASQRNSGLLARVPSEPTYVSNGACRTGMYNHAIAGVVLCEVYGVADAATSEKIRPVIEKALAFTRRMQLSRKYHPADRGGWRYLRRMDDRESDLSITAWQLMFLRAARNAGFHVPAEQIDQAMSYVIRCFERGMGSFTYTLESGRFTRAMAGSGILALAMGGRHDSTMARAAGQWILRQSFTRYNDDRGAEDRYHYGAYYCSQAMFQLGGNYWRRFYPRLVSVLIAHQNRDGSWGPEAGRDGMWGRVYSTALTVQALTVPYQLLPIYQR